MIKKNLHDQKASNYIFKTIQYLKIICLANTYTLLYDLGFGFNHGSKLVPFKFQFEIFLDIYIVSESYYLLSHKNIYNIIFINLIYLVLFMAL